MNFCNFKINFWNFSYKMLLKIKFVGNMIADMLSPWLKYRVINFLLYATSEIFKFSIIKKWSHYRRKYIDDGSVRKNDHISSSTELVTVLEPYPDVLNHIVLDHTLMYRVMVDCSIVKIEYSSVWIAHCFKYFLLGIFSFRVGSHNVLSIF